MPIARSGPLLLPLLVVFLTLLAAAGCTTWPQLNDLPPERAPYLHQRHLHRQGDRLTVAFWDDPAGLLVQRLEYVVHDGELYLWPLRQSRPFEPVSFDLDVSQLRLRRPWDQHVYWLLETRWDGPLERLARPQPLGQYVDRVRADVAPAPATGQTAVIPAAGAPTP